MYDTVETCKFLEVTTVITIHAFHGSTLNKGFLQKGKGSPDGLRSTFYIQPSDLYFDRKHVV